MNELCRRVLSKEPNYLYLAIRLNCSIQTIYRMKKGTHLGPNMIKKCAGYLGITIAEAVKLNEDYK